VTDCDPQHPQSHTPQKCDATAERRRALASPAAKEFPRDGAWLLGACLLGNPCLIVA
jgi:hypothetical protein